MFLEHLMEDNYLHKGLRKKLVDEIRRKGLDDEEVLSAIERVPRHCFMDSSFVKFAYKDQAFPIGAGQTISQPFTVAFQTSLLKIRKRDKVLEIGTGSGYQAAVLCEMGANVFTIERLKELYLKAKTTLSELDYHPHIFYGDGYQGMPTYGPFDKVLITAAAPDIPELLLKQIKVGGRLVVPVGGYGTQIMTLIEKNGEDDYETSDHGYFVFVPMIKGKE